MHATDQVLAIDMTISEECSTMQATPLEHGQFIAKSNGDNIHVPDKKSGGHPVLQIIPSSDCLFVHRSDP